LGSAAADAQFGKGITNLLGLKGSKTGAAIGGTVGKEIGKALNFPGGEAIGAVLGSVVGGLFKKSPKGLVTINQAGTSYSGSGKLRSGLTSSGDGISASIANIAEQLGGSVGNFSTSIRQKKKSFYVGAQKFGTQEEAARAALLDAINQGAVQGITQGAQNLLRAGKDIDVQLGKALRFESVFTRLKAYTDPVGAALDGLDREFTGLKNVFAEAGASAADYASLTSLYEKERAIAIEQGNEKLTASLRSLREELLTGDSGLSLRNRLSNAESTYNPLKARVDAGDTAAYDKFAEAYKVVLDLKRQIGGSDQSYFDFLKEGIDTTGKVITGADNIASISAARAPILTPAQNAAPVVSALDQVIAAINAQGGAQNQNLGSVIDLLRQSNVGAYQFAPQYGFG
jgi:hypothetical protein